MISVPAADSRFADPTWYRVRYALAVQCLQLATLQQPRLKSDLKDRIAASVPGSKKAKAAKQEGWPAAISNVKNLGEIYGTETTALLVDLFQESHFGASHLANPAEAAMNDALDLVGAATMALERAGWRWVGRRPPRYLRWIKGLAAPWGRHPRAARDLELARFLSWVVEPAAVVVLFSAWLLDARAKTRSADQIDAIFPYAEIITAIVENEKTSGPPKPLDRATRTTSSPAWLISYLARLVADWPLETRRLARVEARLGRTRLRGPRRVSARVRYSLACLFSRLGLVASERDEKHVTDRFLQIAAVQLEYALISLPDRERNDLVGWANTDPGLRGLCDLREGEFEEIVARWGSRGGRPMEQALLDSSVARRAAYGAASQILEIEFADGSCFRYLGVPRKTYDDLVRSESPGSYFNEHIRGHYTHIRL